MKQALDTLFLFGENYCATLAIGFVCAYLGLYCVLRRIVFTGVALAQLAAAGVAGAFFLADRNLGPISRFAGTYGATWGSLGMSLLGVLGLELRSKKHGGTTPDALVGLAYAASSAVAILLVWRSSRGLTELQNILAGEVLLTGEGELFSLWCGLGAVALLHFLLRREFLLVSFDPEFARAQGLRERRYQLLLLGSLAVAVALSLKAGGLLLVFAFLVLPPVAGLTIAEGLEQAALFSALTAGAASLLGFLLAIGADWPVGPTVSVCLLGLVIVFRAAKLHPVARAAARWAVGSICTLALLLAPVSLFAGPSALPAPPLPTSATLSQEPAPVAAATPAADEHGHAAPDAMDDPGGIDPSAVSQSLGQGTTQAKLETLSGLGERGKPEDLNSILFACLDDDPAVREAARAAAVAVVEREEAGGKALGNIRKDHPRPKMRLAASYVLVECLSQLPLFQRSELLDILVELNGGDDYGFDPYAEDPAANRDALARWRTWAETGASGASSSADAGHAHDSDPGGGKPVQHLEDRLRAADPQVVQEAIASLRAEGPAAIPRLEGILRAAGGHDCGDGPQRVDPAIPARLLVELDDSAADAVLRATITGPDPVAALAVLAALDLDRHRGFLEETAGGPRTQERRLSIERLAALDDAALAGLMEMGAREGTPAALGWLGRQRPDLLVPVLRDQEPEAAGAALSEHLPELTAAAERGQLERFWQDALRLIAQLAEPELFQRCLPLARALISQPHEDGAEVLAGWLDGLSAGRAAEARTALLGALGPDLLAHPALRRHLQAYLRAGPYDADGELVRDPRPALAALASAGRPDDLDGVLEVLAGSQGEWGEGEAIRDQAEGVWDRLSRAHPAAAQDLAVAVWSAAPDRPLTGSEEHALRRAEVLAGELSWQDDPLTPVAAAWPRVTSSDLRGQLVDALLVSSEGWEVAQLEPLGAWIAALDPDTFPTGLAILQSVVSGSVDPVALSAPLRAGLEALTGARRAEAVRVAVGALTSAELAAPALGWLRQEDLQSGGSLAGHLLRSFELRHEPQDLDLLLGQLPLTPPPEEVETDAEHADHVEHPGHPGHEHEHVPLAPPPLEGAFAFLAHQYPQRALKQVRALLREGQPERRLAVAHRLHVVPAGLAAADAAWAQLDPAARDAAAGSLLRSPDPAVVPWLLERERELGDAAREGLVRRVGEAADARGLPLLERALAAPSPAVRRAARAALSAFREQAEALTELRELRRPRATSEDVEIRLLELLDDPDRRVVLGALQGLAGLRSQRALPRLVELLRSEDDELRQAVQRALDRIAEPFAPASTPAPAPAPTPAPAPATDVEGAS